MYVCENSLPFRYPPDWCHALLTLHLLLVADRTVTHSMISYWHHAVVCLVCLSFRLWRCIVALMVGVGVEWKLCHHVPRTALSIHFFRYFCSRVYRSSTTHSERWNRQKNFPAWNSHWQRDHVTMAISDVGIFGGSFLQLYGTVLSVHRTQYDWPS